MSYSQRLKVKNEATGIRLVSQYIQEYWECRWQPFEQRNDEGIDGIILMRKKNEDLGVKINVQIKCGASYISSFNDDEIRIAIDDANGLKKHLEYWRNQIDPAVLIFVNPSKILRDQHGNPCKNDRGKIVWKESRLKAKAWWVDLKDITIIPDGFSTLIRIDRKQTFGEHSKGDFLDLIEPLLGKKGLQTIIPNSESIKLYNSINILNDAKEYFKIWREDNEGRTICKAINQDVIVSRTGWRHITLGRRGHDRKITSFKLLGIAKQIILESEKFYLLNQDEDSLYITQKLGLRALIGGNRITEQVVQVILLRRIKKSDRTSRWWFYSVHNRN